MTLSSGSRLGSYDIVSPIGAGGMGEVYRAHDSRLHRDVAIKVLPERFAANPEWMARFSREAQMLASLNHPNIAAIHGLEESDGRRALVMELVEGETLTERLARGPIPLDEALGIARQIAEALEEAHERGIIHRDLKPSNVKVTPNGTVKLLDFGLAKALEGEAGVPSSQHPSHSPTLSVMSTGAGVILGTAAYMSPEQARGLRADRRSDIWAFGVVLYEIVTNRQVFTGDTTSDVLASVLKTDVDLGTLPPAVPAAIRQLLRRCLARDPKQRLQSIGDARIVITECLTGQQEAVEPQLAPTRRAPVWQRALPWGLFGVAALAALIVGLWPRTPVSMEPPLRLTVQMGDQPFYMGVGSAIVLSPDGSRIAFVAGDENSRRLSTRSLDQFSATELVSGVGPAAAPYNPFFSPDGKWIGYVTATEMRKIPTSGGTPQTLTKVQRSRGASWGPDDTIVLAPSPESGLFRVPAGGGEPQPLTSLDKKKGELTHRWPQVLPGGKAAIFTVHTKPTEFSQATIEAVVLATGERKVIQRGASYGRYVPTGHLVYVNQGTLFAVPFDADKLETSGSPVPMIVDVSWGVAHGAAQYTISDTGRLAYIQGANAVAEFPIAWVDRKGTPSALWDIRGSYANPRLSPDGKRLSLTVLREGNWDIWVLDLERGVPTRLTFEDTTESEQIWSPDGQYLVFSSDQSGVENLYRKRADGSGETERLTENTNAEWATSWSSDGRFIAFISAASAFDLFTLPMQGDRKPAKFLGTPFTESDPTFSPDGRWMAYTSNESGRTEVYVRPFPPSGGKWQVSDGSGSYPKWSRDGRELFYRINTGIMSATVETVGGTFRAGKPQVVFKGAFRGGIGGLALAGNSFTDYEVAADGQRFVMFPEESERQGERPHITLATSWFDELRQRFARSEK